VSTPISASASSPFTFATALLTPLPSQAAASPSRSSTASCSPVDAPDGRRAPLHLPSLQQRGERGRHVGEDALAPLLLRLDRLPALAHAGRGAGLGVAEDVRVAADELRVHRSRDLLQVAGAALLEQEREEVGLEEQVAELVEQLGVVARERGVGDLVGLLDGVGHDRARGLLAVPGAVPPQPPRQLLELDERIGERHGATWSTCRWTWSTTAAARSRPRSRSCPCSSPRDP
jgi:hypothetical protein